MADSSWSRSWPARRSSARGTMSQQPRDRQPAALQEPQRGHLALLLGRTVAQIGLEDRLLAHGEDLVAVPLLEQPGTDHAAKHLTGDGLHVACRAPLVAAHHRSERSIAFYVVWPRAESPGRCLVQHAIPSPLGWRPQPHHPITPSCGQPPGGGRYRLPATGPSGTPATDGRLDPAATDPDGHRDRLRVVGPVQDGVGGGLADGQDQVVDHLVRDGGWHLRQAVSDGAPQLGKAARRAGKRGFHVLPPAGVAATAVGGRYGVAAADPIARPPTSGQRGWPGGATPRPYACASTGGWLARSRACCAWLDASRSSASRPRRSRSWRRVALSRSSSATLLSRSRRAARSWRRLARRAPEERQASPSSSAPSRPSPAATSSSWPWVKLVIDWSKTETELALVLARTASPSNDTSTTASTRNNAAMLPPVALGWLGGGAARVPVPVGLRKRLAFPHRLAPNRGKRSGPSAPGRIGHVRRRAWWCWRGRAAPIVGWMAGQAGGHDPRRPSRPMLRSSTACTKGRRRYLG